MAAKPCRQCGNRCSGRKAGRKLDQGKRSARFLVLICRQDIGQWGKTTIANKGPEGNRPSMQGRVTDET